MEEINGTKEHKGIIRVDGEYWHYYFNTSKTWPKITGKYLFFSESKAELEKIAIHELETGGFYRAKINTDRHKKGKDYVLCLYYEDGSRKYELAEKYKSNTKVKYRYWKSDADTIEGKYSEQFLEHLSPEERKEWVKKKM